MGGLRVGYGGRTRHPIHRPSVPHPSGCAFDGDSACAGTLLVLTQLLFRKFGDLRPIVGDSSIGL